MSIAGRHGKLVENAAADAEGWSRVEDLLTADVFGAYRYLPARLGVIPFLLRARDASGKSLAQWLSENHVAVELLDQAEIDFWPRFSNRKEPDVLVRLGSGGDHSVAVLVEAKLESGQHVIDGLSQLGFYACCHFRGDYDEVQEALAPVRPVVFVTKHVDCPTAELAYAAEELAEVDGDGVACAVFWVSWHAARDAAQEMWDETREEVLAKPWLRLLNDVIEDVTARGLVAPRQRVHFPMPRVTALAATCTPWLAAFRLGNRRRDRAVSPMPRLPRLTTIDAALDGWRIA